MATAQLGHVEIAYEVDGPPDGEPLLLVMGLGTQLVAWPTDFVAALVERGFRVIRHDNRDIGLSSFTESPPPSRAAVVRSFLRPGTGGADYLLADMAEDARALLDHLDVATAHVVGASMGGMIAQQLTVDHPERVRSLTSIMSTTGSRRHGRVHPSLLPSMALSLTQGHPSDEEEAVRLGVEGWRRIAGPLFDEEEMTTMVRAAVRRSVSPIGTVRQLLAILESPDRTERLASVQVPTLVVHGLADRLVAPSGGIATARAVPGSRLLMFPDMGHDLPRARRDEIAEAIARNAARAVSPARP
ncbi:alpha/beta fold hydrolase [Phycicoccus endophyticus]|uniref:Alpha/beta fold hydrolase n=1 Tax=Phycicoccus endophyticus TaxID=1690220 RepID=A0A7G9R570_9MICO|nr:alpha/beta fold hydrolase [Phycicoccus endophyticus]NHI20652.1 alpha/beta fold hydrolase [Phycicoccus endophyticus]QNN50745.1 alpha/beta fold hydrolase [Phycicoccus endophyticus]GGL43439.1 alpha/beta hydrolase [Phycicoccus endophyticus]